DHDLQLAAQVHEVGSMLKILSKREERILCLYYGLAGSQPVSLDDIAALYNLSRERVRQLKDRGLKKLRSRLIRRKIINTYHS
ncbi:MAG TPA: sigma factor-like helix-turn-helix DNA-binding protein, partial [Pedobacter sp.]